MFDSPHTSAPMLMRGKALVFEKHLSKMPREPALRNTCHGPRTSLPQRAFHPTNHVQQDIHPIDNLPPSARKRGAGEARRRVGRRRGRLPGSARQSLFVLVMQSSVCVLLRPPHQHPGHRPHGTVRWVPYRTHFANLVSLIHVA